MQYKRPACIQWLWSRVPCGIGVLLGCLSTLLQAELVDTITLHDREAFSVPLAKIGTGYDKTTDEVDMVRITFSGSDNQYIISRFDDVMITNPRTNSRKIIYRETADKAYCLSNFERKCLQRVFNSLIATLTIFEHDLAKQHWGRLVYLDAFFPRFLHGLQLAVCTARNSADPSFSSSYIAGSEYDVSLYSEKSDRRINWWVDHPAYTLQLRFVAKELTYQIKILQKKMLAKNKMQCKETLWRSYDDVFNLFAKVYFNKYPIPPR